MDTVKDEIRDVLRRRRHVKFNQPDNFAIFTPDALSDFWNQLTGGIFVFMFAVSSVGLMVGGVGVMNIMLVSVTERTREIGIRMAVGARRRDVMMQFLAEAVLVCVLGGAIGIALSFAASWVFSAFVDQWRMVFSTKSLVAAVACSTVIGVAFGFLPARRAARLDPVEALARD
jgi:ABC-type antimicrobial peptide transport system permease subunit